MKQDQKLIAKIKDAVRGNFDQSPESYESFERRYSFFRDLNRELTANLSFPDRPKILDIGCGSAASSVQMLDHIPNSTVYGVDISESMIQKARELHGERSGLHLFVGDAATLTELFSDHFDLIVYSASIFLIPDFELSLRQAGELLTPMGAVGLTFMEGLYDKDDNNLLELIETSRGIGISLKRAVKLHRCVEYFGELFPSHDLWRKDYEPDLEQLKTFFSVPAMSAGLFPSLPYEKRLEKVDDLFSLLPKSDLRFRWVFMTGKP